MNKVYICISTELSGMPYILEFSAFRGLVDGQLLCATISAAPGIESCALGGALPQEWKRIYRDGAKTDEFIHDYVVVPGPSPEEVTP